MSSSPRGAVTPMGTTPRIKVYKVAAVFEIGMSEYDAAFVFMPLTEAQAYFNRNNDVTAIEVYTNNPDRIDNFRKLVSDAAKRPIFMIDWRQRNATFFNALQVERNVMFLILTLIVLVAALNIVSGLIMLVKDKGQDIAILRTMGATRGTIMRIFFLAGASVGTIGTLAGLGLGIAFADNIETIRQWPESIVYLENYDMGLARLLTRGCDLWLNTPRRPLEASGTSGIKAAMNGALNLSVLDGWWPEGCDPGVTGWAIGDGTEGPAQDERDLGSLYDTLEEEVLPIFANQSRWTSMMRASIRMAQERFSSDRMVTEYFARLYSPGA